MNRARHILIPALVLMWAGMATADLAVRPVAGVPDVLAPVANPATIPSAEIDASSVRQPDSADSGPVLDFAPAAFDASSLLGGQSWSELPLAPIAETQPLEVRELPGLPSSSSLFLSAVLSVGAWHMVRKAGQVPGYLHWGQLPEWYYPDAPHQVGHAVVFDLQYAPIAVCSFDEPLVASDQVRFFDTPREVPSRCESRSFLSVEAPRGPPTLS